MRYTVRCWTRVGLLSVALLVAQALAWSTPGFAQPTPADRAAAEALFEQALTAMEAGNAAEACPKLEESQRLDPGVGTVLYLADCYETIGRTASAWATFLQAAYMAKDAGQIDRQQVAEEHAEALKPKLAKLVLRVADPALPGLVITNDAQQVGEALWGSEVPVDPGPHRIEAVAAGKQRWSGVVTIPPGPSLTEFGVPTLEDVEVIAPPPRPAERKPTPVARPPAESPESDASVSLKTWGWIAVGAGGAGLITGGVLSLLALSDNSDADAECRSGNPGLCSPEGVELGDAAESKAQVATLFGGVGATLAVAGAVLVLMSPDEDSALSALRIGPQLAAAGGGLFMEGSW